MGTGIHGPGSLDDVLSFATWSDDWTAFCGASSGDGIQDGGGVPMLPGFSAEGLVMRYNGLLASMAVASGSVSLVL